MSDGVRVKPLPGRCFVKLQSRHRIREQIIWIPEVGMRVFGMIGEVLDYTLWDAPKPARIYQRGSLVWIKEPWRMNTDFAGMLGKTIVMGAGTAVELNTGAEILHVVRLEHIDAIVPAGTKVAESFEPLRCSRCASGGEANILMDADGYCPQCGLDIEGNPRPSGVQITEEEIWDMATEEEREILQRVHKIGPSPRKPGQVIIHMGRANP